MKTASLCVNILFVFVLDTVAVKLVPSDRNVIKKNGKTHIISKYYVVPNQFDANKGQNVVVSQTHRRISINSANKGAQHSRNIKRLNYVTLKGHGRIDNEVGLNLGSVGRIENGANLHSDGTEIENEAYLDYDTGDTIENVANVNYNRDGRIENGADLNFDSERIENEADLNLDGDSINNEENLNLYSDGTIENESNLNLGGDGSIDNEADLNLYRHGTIEKESDLNLGGDGSIDNEEDLNINRDGPIESGADINLESERIENESDLNLGGHGSIDNEADLNLYRDDVLENEANLDLDGGSRPGNEADLYLDGDGSIDNEADVNLRDGAIENEAVLNLDTGLSIGNKGYLNYESDDRKENEADLKVDTQARFENELQPNYDRDGTVENQADLKLDGKIEHEADLNIARDGRIDDEDYLNVKPLLSPVLRKAYIEEDLDSTEANEDSSVVEVTSDEQSNTDTDIKNERIIEQTVSGHHDDENEFSQSLFQNLDTKLHYIIRSHYEHPETKLDITEKIYEKYVNSASNLYEKITRLNKLIPVITLLEILNKEIEKNNHIEPIIDALFVILLKPMEDIVDPRFSTDKTVTERIRRRNMFVLKCLQIPDEGELNFKTQTFPENKFDNLNPNATADDLDARRESDKYILNQTSTSDITGRDKTNQHIEIKTSVLFDPNIMENERSIEDISPDVHKVYFNYDRPNVNEDNNYPYMESNNIPNDLENNADVFSIHPEALLETRDTSEYVVPIESKLNETPGTQTLLDDTSQENISSHEYEVHSPPISQSLIKEEVIPLSVNDDFLPVNDQPDQSSYWDENNVPPTSEGLVTINEDYSEPYNTVTADKKLNELPDTDFSLEDNARKVKYVKYINGQPLISEWLIVKDGTPNDNSDFSIETDRNKITDTYLLTKDDEPFEQETNIGKPTAGISIENENVPENYGVQTFETESNENPDAPISLEEYDDAPTLDDINENTDQSVKQVILENESPNYDVSLVEDKFKNENLVGIAGGHDVLPVDVVDRDNPTDLENETSVDNVVPVQDVSGEPTSWHTLTQNGATPYGYNFLPNSDNSPEIDVLDLAVVPDDTLTREVVPGGYEAIKIPKALKVLTHNDGVPYGYNIISHEPVHNKKKVVPSNLEIENSADISDLNFPEEPDNINEIAPTIWQILTKTKDTPYGQKLVSIEPILNQYTDIPYNLKNNNPAVAKEVLNGELLQVVSPEINQIPNMYSDGTLESIPDENRYTPNNLEHEKTKNYIMPVDTPLLNDLMDNRDGSNDVINNPNDPDVTNISEDNKSTDNISPKGYELRDEQTQEILTETDPLPDGYDVIYIGTTEDGKPYYHTVHYKELPEELKPHDKPNIEDQEDKHETEPQFTLEDRVSNQPATGSDEVINPSYITDDRYGTSPFEPDTKEEPDVYINTPTESKLPKYDINSFFNMIKNKDKERPPIIKETFKDFFSPRPKQGKIVYTLPYGVKEKVVYAPENEIIQYEVPINFHQTKGRYITHPTVVYKRPGGGTITTVHQSPVIRGSKLIKVIPGYTKHTWLKEPPLNYQIKTEEHPHYFVSQPNYYQTYQQDILNYGREPIPNESEDLNKLKLLMEQENNNNDDHSIIRINPDKQTPDTGYIIDSEIQQQNDNEEPNQEIDIKKYINIPENKYVIPGQSTIDKNIEVNTYSNNLPVTKYDQKIMQPNLNDKSYKVPLPNIIHPNVQSNTYSEVEYNIPNTNILQPHTQETIHYKPGHKNINSDKKVITYDYNLPAHNSNLQVPETVDWNNQVTYENNLPVPNNIYKLIQPNIYENNHVVTMPDNIYKVIEPHVINDNNYNIPVIDTPDQVKYVYVPKNVETIIEPLDHEYVSKAPNIVDVNDNSIIPGPANGHTIIQYNKNEHNFNIPPNILDVNSQFNTQFQMSNDDYAKILEKLIQRPKIIFKPKPIEDLEIISGIKNELPPTYKLFTADKLLKLRQAILKKILSGARDRAVSNLYKINTICLKLANHFGGKKWYENLFFPKHDIKHVLEDYTYHLLRQRWLHELMIILSRNNLNLDVIYNPNVYSIISGWHFPKYVTDYLKLDHSYIPKDIQYLSKPKTTKGLTQDLIDIRDSSILLNDNNVNPKENLHLSIPGFEESIDAYTIADIVKKYLSFKKIIEQKEYIINNLRQKEMFKQILLLLRQKGYGARTMIELLKRLYGIVLSAGGSRCRYIPRTSLNKVFDIVGPVLRRSGKY